MEQVAQVEKFFSERSTKGFDRTLAQALDAVRARARWVERDGGNVKQWLKENGYFA
jgi:aminopeptidase 2